MAQNQKEDQFIEELKKWADEEEELDPEVEKQAEEFGKLYQEAVDIFTEDEEDRIVSILAEDNYLMEELCDKLALVNLLGATEEGIMPADYEDAYLSLLDTCFESAKIINPLDGFGLERLKTGLDILKSFEEEYWNLLTRVGRVNIDAFRGMIPEEHLDDLLIGRKKGIGMMLHKGTVQQAVGVLLYSMVDTEAETALKLEWIYVDENYRKRGVANVLMAYLLELSLAAEDVDVLMEVGIPRAEDEKEAEEVMEAHSVFMNFIDSWQFDCRYRMAKDFYVGLNELKGKPGFDKTEEGVVNLGSLNSAAGEEILKYIVARNRERRRNEEIVSLDFYDPDVSCAVVKNKRVLAMFLVHRYESGDYRLEFLGGLQGYDRPAMEKLLHFAYRAALEKGDGDSMFSGVFESEEGYALAKELIPFAHTQIKMAGRLNGYLAGETVSSEDWGHLRREAGFSNDIFLSDKDPAEEIPEEDLKKLVAFLKA